MKKGITVDPSSKGDEVRGKLLKNVTFSLRFQF
jgi:hypothetical protein